MLELGVPLGAGLVAHGAIAGGSSATLDILDTTSGTFEALHAGLGYHHEIRPGRGVEMGADFGRQVVDWSGTGFGFRGQR
jgi:hypothetical protein